MGRKQANKKKLREEKAKVKLKTSKTKFLPKGQNVTNTTFKIKPIVLPQQLKSRESEDILSSKRKLDLKDILSRIHHHNENVRFGACEELLDLVKTHSEAVVTSNLSNIIQQVSVLVQDRESKVRRGAVKAIKAVLEKTNGQALNPFFNHLSTNLRCAMTNINRSIQEDSLLLLDVLLEQSPILIAKNCDKILPDFFTLISKLRSDSNLERTLTVNLTSKLTTVKWRIKVLSRLYGILQAITTENQQEKEENNNEKNYSFAIRATEDEMDFYETDSNSQEILNNQVWGLVPLLYETWIEVVPQSNAELETTVLNDESSAILACIVNILYMLYQCLEKYNCIDNLIQSSKKLFDKLIQQFPYSQGERLKQSKKDKSLQMLEGNEDLKCVKENILICYLFSCFNIKSANQRKSQFQKISAYLIKCLKSKTHINSNNADYFILFLDMILLKHQKYWSRIGIGEVFENAINFYYNSKLPDKARIELLQVFLNISEEDLIYSAIYQEWIADLPKLLCEREISEGLIKALLEVSKRKNEAFHEAFLENFEAILNNLNSLKVFGCEDEDKAKASLCCVLFYMPVLEVEHLEVVCSFIDDNLGSSLGNEFIDVLKTRQEYKFSRDFEVILQEKTWWK